MDPLTYRLLDRALVDLSDEQLATFAGKVATLLAGQYREDGVGQLALLGAFHAVVVIAEEQKDARRHAVEAARVALDGLDAGSIWDGSPPSFD